jgi:dihydroflavonol-4-reductase
MTSTLVTGATGFIGKRLIKYLCEEGREISCFVRHTSNVQELEKYGVELKYGDILDAESVKSALKNVDTVYHLAADAHPSNYRPYSAYAPNVTGAKNILEASLDYPIRKIIVMSSIAATGPSQTGFWCCKFVYVLCIFSRRKYPG